tara:strand:+ start:961 stop:1365 length:405 start_codon:yes stop_codon:yes gene_type:complete
MLAGILTILPKVLEIVDKSLPDKAKADLAKQQIEFELMSAVNEINKAQAETNKAEATHRSIFVAGWRPAVGWCAALGVFWAFIGQPMCAWVALMFNVPFMLLPQFPMEQVMELVLAMLGLSGLRTFEKMQGVTS